MAEAPKKKDAPKKADAPTMKAAEAPRKADTLKQDLAARAKEPAPSEQPAPDVVQPENAAKESAPPCDGETETEAAIASGKVLSTSMPARDPSGGPGASVSPATASGAKKPELPPPPGKDHAAKKAADNARHAPVEVARLLNELGRKFGTAFGEAEAELNNLKAIPGQILHRDEEHYVQVDALLDAHQANLARRLNALPELPTFADPKLAAIAQRAFEVGFGAGVAEAKARGASVDLAFTAALALTPAAAAGVANAAQRAGAAALRGALTRFRGMPIFLPTAVGGGGGFLRAPKPGCKLSGPATGSGSGSAAASTPTTGGVPRNGHLAGSTHPKTGVPFDAKGYPDFKAAGIVKKEVKITQTGSRPGDFAASNKAAGYDKTPDGYTWHHHQDGTTMQLVPYEIHRATGHTGGYKP